MAEDKLKAVLDTNILISALIFGGQPRELLKLVTDRKLVAFTSPSLLAELLEILSKKFKFGPVQLTLVERKIKKTCYLVHPKQTLATLKDEVDNRVLEAAIEGGADCIVTGDKELLQLKKCQDVKVVTVSSFLELFRPTPSRL